MRVSYILPNLQKGGTERRVVRLACNGSWDSRLMLMYSRGDQDDDPELLAELSAAEVPIERLHMGGFRTARGLLKSFKGARLAKRLLRQNETQIVHGFLPSANLLAILSRPNRAARTVISQAALCHYRRKLKALRRVEDFFYPRADAVLCNSQAVRDDLLADCPPLDADRCHIVYNGIEQDHFQFADTETDTDISPREAARRRYKTELLDVSPETNVLVILANLIPYKGHDDLINALAQVTTETPWQLICVGGNPQGWQRDLEQLAAKHQLADNIRFVGSQSNAWQWLLAADALISASHEEGFSNAVVEAMAAELPVIATNVGGNPEAVGSESPYLCEVKNPNDIARAIQLYFDDPGQAATIAKANRDKAARDYTLDAMCRNMATFYENLLEEK
jgi:glycosyltransferase involved in cell wall biosynthesis